MDRAEHLQSNGSGVIYNRNQNDTLIHRSDITYDDIPCVQVYRLRSEAFSAPAQFPKHRGDNRLLHHEDDSSTASEQGFGSATQLRLQRGPEALDDGLVLGATAPETVYKNYKRFDVSSADLSLHQGSGVTIHHQRREKYRKGLCDGLTLTL